MTAEAGEMLVREVMPRIAAVVPRCVRRFGCEDDAELIQDAVVIAAKILHNAEAAGKRLTPGNVAYYAIKKMQGGRRSGGNQTVDVMGVATQLVGRSTMVSINHLQEVANDDEDAVSLADALSNDREDPSVIAGREIDWSRFMATQNPYGHRIVRGLAKGETMETIKEKCGVGGWRLNGEKKKLAGAAREFFGETVLADAGQSPRWKSGLAANRHRKG